MAPEGVEMDFNEDFNSIVEHSLGEYDSRKLFQPQVVHFVHDPTAGLEAEAKEVSLWLFENGIWTDSERTIKVVAPPGEDNPLRVLYPLTGQPAAQSGKLKVRYNLDSSARIWMRGRGDSIHVRSTSQFEDENEILRVVQLLCDVRRAMT
ncbi:hypothetical protein D3C85_1429550 [compost metagenome]